MNRILLISLLVMSYSLSFAQPNTDVYLLKVSQGNGTLNFSEAQNLTPRKGYDNQPSFVPDEAALLYVSIGRDGQSDVYRYDIEAGSAQRLTETKKHSEYSPIVMPKGKTFSAVVVEPDSSQRLWQYPIEGGKGEVLIETIDGIGYYSWYHKKKLLAFLLGDPFTLQNIHAKKEQAKTVASQIGRSILTHPTNGSLSFVDKSDSTQWMIRSWNPKSKEISPIVATLEESEDVCWTPEGHLLTAKGAELYRFRPGVDQTWVKQADLGVGPFYRLVMSPDGQYLAVVVFAGEKP
ncbi:MAG: hypothetical protein AAF399_24345 [Bacteroidota bacterium]